LLWTLKTSVGRRRSLAAGTVMQAALAARGMRLCEHCHRALPLDVSRCRRRDCPGYSETWARDTCGRRGRIWTLKLARSGPDLDGSGETPNPREPTEKNRGSYQDAETAVSVNSEREGLWCAGIAERRSHDGRL
jgi:hypothetical protein